MADVERKYLVCAVNMGTSTTPIWSVLGYKVEDSSVEFEADSTTITDILGDTYTDINKITLSQSFEPTALRNNDKLADELLDAVLMGKVSALTGKDLLLIKGWNKEQTTPFDAYRYPESTITPTSVGGSGKVTLPFTVNFGGEVVKGTVDSIKAPIAFSEVITG